MDLKFLELLGKRDYLRRLLENASLRTSSFYRFIFCDSLTKLVYTAWEQYHQNFDEILPQGSSFWVVLNSGRIGALHGALQSVDFSSNGRGIASLAFLVNILNHLDASGAYSKGFTSEILSLLVWPKIRFVLNYKKIAALEAEVYPSMSTSRLPPITRMVPMNRIRDQEQEANVEQPEDEVPAQNLFNPRTPPLSSSSSQSSQNSLDSESESDEGWLAMD
ncbi:E1B 19K [bottlenose dolphin adenovirus 2]|uniref:E1B protein, small T-antigen n=1 Tax=bottlenose dolphin adenovirus 2 TaxID=2849592 RepID=A0A0M4LS43_9ADEN|nr:E1B 19K [Bottlenose dolphin adenovirus 1]ALE15291.1 E1B 19K [Bottlenose dolphin adenovirus 1]